MDELPISEVDEKYHNGVVDSISWEKDFWGYEKPKRHFWNKRRFGCVDVLTMRFYSDYFPFPTRVLAGIKDGNLYAVAYVHADRRNPPPFKYALGGWFSFDEEYEIDTQDPQGMLSELSDLPEGTRLGDLIDLLSLK